MWQIAFGCGDQWMGWTMQWGLTDAQPRAGELTDFFLVLVLLVVHAHVLYI